MATSTSGSSLRSWLRRQPQPHSVRIVTEDDEVRPIKLSSDARNRWKGAEEAILNSKAVVVECLDEEGAIIRSLNLGDSEEGGADSADAAERRVEKNAAKHYKELGFLFDRYADRLNEAFERGAQAANVGQDNLVQIVATMSQQWSATMVSLHNLSVTMANQIMQQAQEQGGGSEESMMRMFGALAGKLGGGGGDTPSAAKPTNGKANGKT
jgi:hypothetical protein